MLTNIADAFGATFGALPSYKDGILRGFDYTDVKGTVSKTPFEAPCKVQVDSLTQSQLAEGFQEDDVRLIILSAGLGKWLPNARVQDDYEVQIPSLNVTYRISGPTRDPMDTHWSCRGRVKPNA